MSVFVSFVDNVVYACKHVVVGVALVGSFSYFIVNKFYEALILIFSGVDLYKKIKLPDGRLLEGPGKLLGKGSFGIVCQYQLDKKLVAVKIPNSREYNALQQHELELLKKANPHMNVINYIDRVEVDRKIWIVMELMKGSVHDLLVKNPGLSPKTKLSIAIQITTGIVHLHNFNSAYFSREAIVHQDLKTDNILVDRLDDDPKINIKISDFGIARQVNQLTLPIFGKISSKLYKGQVGGTLLYTAPEVINGMVTKRECCEPKSDVYSAGIVFWEVATARRPNRSIQEIHKGTFDEFNRDKNTNRQRITKTSFFGEVTETLSEPTYPMSSFLGPIIDKCVQPKIDDRNSANSILKRLQQIELK
mgnify:CR=1 FL=1